MAARWNLTGGAIEGIMAGQQYEKPLLQVLGQKKVMGGQSATPERYRLLLSDGEQTNSSAMLATQLNDKVTSGQLDTNCIIRLDKYICNAIQPDKRVLILLEVTVLASGAEVGSKIGNPQQMRAVVGGDNNAASAVSKPGQVNMQPLNKTGFSANGSDINRNTRPAAVNTASNSSSGFQRETNMQNSKGFYAGNQKPTNMAAKSPFGGGAANVSSGADTPSKVHQIASLTPYQNRWTIRARVTQKSAIRSWSNSRGEGTLFDMTLLDESGDIRATAFKSEVDKFYNLIEVNKVYYIRKAVLKTANKQYSSTNSDYDMTFTSETEVIPCDDACDLPTINFNFVPINQLESHKANDTIDVIGVVKEVDDIRTIVTKQTNKELKKREVVLVDETKVQVRLTLWGNDAETFDGNGNPVLAIRACRLSDWGGRSLSSLSNSQIILNPDIPESHRLRGWFDNVGRSVDYTEYKREGGTGAGSSGASNWKTFADVKAQNLGQDKADFFTAKATFVFMKKENSMYQACPQQDCNKKVVDQGNGNYRCEKCQKEYPDYKWRMILSANLADFSDNQWITCFQETAEAVLGKSAEEIGQLKENDVSRYDQMFAEANFKSYIFRLRAKMETYNDESRLKTVCVQAIPINYLEYNQKVIADIEALLGSV